MLSGFNSSSIYNTNSTSTMNSSNITLILKRIKRHLKYVGEPFVYENCYRPYNYEEHIEEACHFVLEKEVCSGSVVFVNYLKILVCHFHLENNAVGLVVMSLLSLVGSIVFFSAAFVITRYFLYPNTVVLVDCLKVNQYTLGALIIAIIRCFPQSVTDGGSCDTFSRAFALKHAEYLGRFIIDFLIGLSFICCVKSIRISGGIFLRDTLIITCGVIFIHITLLTEMYNMFLPPVERAKPMIVYSSYLCMFVYVMYTLILIARERMSDINHSTSITSISTTGSFASDEYPHEEEYSIESDVDPCNVFFMNINPMLNMQDNYIVLKFLLAPFFIVTALLVPVVRHDRELHGWHKFLFCFSVIPIVIFVASMQVTIRTLVCTYSVAIIFICMVYCLTNSQRKPKYHDYTTIWNMLLATVLICMIENEMKVFVGQLFGYFLNWNDEALNLFWFPFNSAGLEGVYIYLLIKKGYHEVAFAVVMGSMIYMVYSSLPSMTLGVCFQVDQYFLVTPLTQTAFVFVYISISMVLMSISLSGFVLRWSHGVLFICLIIVFSLYVILSNSFFTHPYGTVHAEQLYPNLVHSDWA